MAPARASPPAGIQGGSEGVECRFGLSAAVAATVVTVKVLETGEGRLRFSVKAAKDAEERAQFEEVRDKAGAKASFGTFGDLLKKRK